MSERRLTVAVMLVLSALAGGSGPALRAEEGSAADPWAVAGRDDLGTRLVDAPTPWTVGERKLELLISHRFVAAIDDSDGHTLWGLDSGADVGLGVRWGFTERLDASLYRARFDETYELAAKLQIWDQGAGAPLSAAVQLGVDHVGNDRVVDSTRPFAQLALSRRLAPGWNLLVVPTWVRDTPRLENAFNVAIGLTVPLRGRALLEVEVIPAHPELDSSQTTWHVALSSRVGGHVFELVLGNSRATTVDQWTGGDFAGGFDEGDLRLGFNIIRHWRFGDE
jgi:hypothetical protein